jgi:hypothetical protein
MHWREAGGPAVRPPERRGFGSTLIERAISHGVPGRATLDFAPEGLRCDIELALGDPMAVAEDLPDAPPDLAAPWTGGARTVPAPLH